VQTLQPTSCWEPVPLRQPPVTLRARVQSTAPTATGARASVAPDSPPTTLPEHVRLVLLPLALRWLNISWALLVLLLAKRLQ
jgi:hypothetical protein